MTYNDIVCQKKKKKGKRRATRSATSEIGSHMRDIIQVFIVRIEAFQGFIKCIVRTETFQGFIKCIVRTETFQGFIKCILKEQVKKCLCSVNQDGYIWADQKNKQDQFHYTCVSATV